MKTTILNLATVHYLPIAAIKTVGEFKDAIASLLGVVMLLTFVAAVGFYMAGVAQRSRNPEASHSCFITAFLFGTAFGVVTLFFFIGGSSAATVDPKFS